MNSASFSREIHPAVHLRLAARHSSLRALREGLERFCAEEDIERATRLRANLVLEELFTNTVDHGHRTESDSAVWVCLRVETDRLHIRYEDEAPAFNPLAKEDPREVPDPAERQLGGLGILLSREVARELRYSFPFGRNRLEVSIERPARG